MQSRLIRLFIKTGLYQVQSRLATAEAIAPFIFRVRPCKKATQKKDEQKKELKTKRLNNCAKT